MSGFQGKYLARGTCLGVVNTPLVYQAIIMDNKICKDGDGTNDRVLWQSSMSTSERQEIKLREMSHWITI